MSFDNDYGDRKRRFLRGLNRILGLDWVNLEDDIELRECLTIGLCGVLEMRNSLASIYGLEFTGKELDELIVSGMTTLEFTEKYCPVIYQERGDKGLNELIAESSEIVDGEVVVNLSEIDKSFKYGLNGGEWCDVAEGPCSCGAWHH